jgi:hypothetical protein
VHGIAPPTFIEAVHQVPPHAAMILPREDVSSEEELCVPAVEPFGKLLHGSGSLSPWRSFLPASTAVPLWRQTLAQWLTTSQHGFRKYGGGGTTMDVDDARAAEKGKRRHHQMTDFFFFSTLQYNDILSFMREKKLKII